jgi:hypothetical protein
LLNPFDMDGDGVEVLASYTNGLIAAAVAPCGSGRVGVLGPHPEAPSEWYQDYDLPDLSASSQAPWDDMLHTLMGTRQGPGALAPAEMTLTGQRHATRRVRVGSSGVLSTHADGGHRGR